MTYPQGKLPARNRPSTTPTTRLVNINLASRPIEHNMRMASSPMLLDDTPHCSPSRTGDGSYLDKAGRTWTVGPVLDR
jgi:hypothetical protein